MSKADEYKKIALEILREYLESEEAVIFEYSGNFRESAIELKETAMGYLERLGEGEDVFSKLVEKLLIADYYKKGEETDGRGES